MTTLEPVPDGFSPHLHRWELAVPDVVSDVLDDEAVIINLDTGMYFRATGRSSLVWSAVIDGADVGAVADERRDELSEFVGELAGHGLIRPRDTAPEGAPPLPDWPAGSLAIESHADLQDLLALDPVHDVETAAGWPHQPT